MYHCFTNEIGPSTARVTGDDVNHIKNVLRMKVGDDFYASDGAGRDVLCCISFISGDEVLADILSERTDSELPVEIVLYQSLPKSDKMELIIQKCVELGISRIVPVESSRCIVKLDDKSAGKKVERWQKLARSASEQSQRGRIAEIGDVISWKAALQDAGALEHVVICYENETASEELKTLLHGAGGLKSIGIFIGPEGGYSEEEVAQAIEAGIHPITLGHRILRTETAGLALVSALMLNIESNL